MALKTRLNKETGYTEVWESSEEYWLPVTDAQLEYILDSSNQNKKE